MGCGKSKHAVETATTVVKSSDGGTTTTKTVKETGGGSLVQKEVETKSLRVEDTKKETVTTKVDPGMVAKIDNVAPMLLENGEKPTQVLKEDVKVKDSSPTDNVIPQKDGKAAEVAEGDEKVKDLSPVDANGLNSDNLGPALTKDDVGVTEVVKEDEGKRDSTLKQDDKAKTHNVPPTEEEKVSEPNLIKENESNQTKDNKTKTEFMTPTSEDAAGPFEVVKGNEEVKDSNEESITTPTSDEKPMKTADGSSNPKDDDLKVEEPKLVVQATESTKVEAKKEGDVEVTKVDIAKATETEKVLTANEAKVAEAQEKEP